MKRLIALLLLSIPFLLFAQTDEHKTEKGSLTIHPVLHATMVLEWNGLTVYVDPYGGPERFENFEAPDLVLITDIHGDHLNKSTLEKLDLSKAQIIAPKAVVDKLGDLSYASDFALSNGSKMETKGIEIMALPMYNLPETADSRHPKGRGNGYVLTMGGKRLYVSGDTEDIQEMRALKNIDYAFVCMNLPYTMDVEAAASAVIEFSPKIVYPFHYRGGGGKFSDVEAFKKLVNNGNEKVEVRLRNWYPEK